MDLDFEGLNGGRSGEGELVWQASQSNCEALDRLLTDAHSEKIGALVGCLFSLFVHAAYRFYLSRWRCSFF